MDKREFKGRFSPHIRVKVDWHLFEEPAVSVRVVHLQLPRDVGLLWTPWRSASADAESSAGHTAPASVAAIARDVAIAGRHTASVQRHEETVGATDLEAPALELSEGRYLLLDGNHKTVAAAIREIPLQLKLYVISKPDDMHLLIDIPPFD